MLLGALFAACARGEAPEAAQVDFGTVMAEIGRRFELLGRASLAGRYELADYQLGELEEAFTEALPHASPPKEGHPEVLPPLVSGFVQTAIPDLRAAIAAHDRATIDAAFARTATLCNRCHAESGHGFIEVPTAAGRSVPSTEPVAP